MHVQKEYEFECKPTQFLWWKAVPSVTVVMTLGVMKKVHLWLVPQSKCEAIASMELYRLQIQCKKDATLDLFAYTTLRSHLKLLYKTILHFPFFFTIVYFSRSNSTTWPSFNDFFNLRLQGGLTWHRRFFHDDIMLEVRSASEQNATDSEITCIQRLIFSPLYAHAQTPGVV